MKQTTITKVAQSDEPLFENGNKVSAMYHNSDELGLRTVHNPTRMEGAEHNIKSNEYGVFINKKAIKVLLDMTQTLREHNEFQQTLIDKLMVRVQVLEAKN